MAPFVLDGRVKWLWQKLYGPQSLEYLLPSLLQRRFAHPCLDHSLVDAPQPSPFIHEKAEVHKDYINVPKVTILGETQIWKIRNAKWLVWQVKRDSRLISPYDLPWQGGDTGRAQRSQPAQEDVTLHWIFRSWWRKIESFWEKGMTRRQDIQERQCHLQRCRSRE